jgi:hypothetical protein
MKIVLHNLTSYDLKAIIQSEVLLLLALGLL